jgi:hypothetical protein
LQAIDPSSSDTVRTDGSSLHQHATDSVPQIQNYFLGYGNQPFFAEFDHDGNLLLDVQFGVSNVVNGYRTYKLAWQGKPSTTPDIHLDTGAAKAYVSWNGATDVQWWDFYSANATNGTWHHAAAANRTGFETTVDLGGVRLGTYLRAKAVNGSGDALGWTQATDGKALFEASGNVEEQKSSTSSSVVSTTARPTASSSTAAAPESSTSGVAVRIGQGMVEKVVVAVVVVALV